MLSLSRSARQRGCAKPREPLVCVTFDDGYLDNYTHAAPVLLRHGVPAAFFVSTGIVASDRRFPHDVRRENPPIPVMQWDHLREMRRCGFHDRLALGVAHRLRRGTGGPCVRELAQSRDDLRRELGLSRTSCLPTLTAAAST